MKIAFVPSLARKIYAGADMFLMPSKSEPCGLSQMVALRYGTIPIVRETGGLRDSIHDSGDGWGNGFTFRSYNAHDMLNAVLRAKTGYEYPDGWQQLVKRAMECDFSWSASCASSGDAASGCKEASFCTRFCRKSSPPLREVAWHAAYKAVIQASA